MTDAEQGGIQWLVEERDRLRARVAILENELVRRDEARPSPGPFWVQLDELEVQRMLVVGAATGAGVADALAPRLAREIVGRCLHRIVKGPQGQLMLVFDGKLA